MRTQGWATPEIGNARLWLSRRLRAENAVEAVAVLQEDQNPQHASDQRGCDAARCHRQVKRKDVVEFRGKQCQRKWYEKTEEQQQPTKHLQRAKYLSLGHYTGFLIRSFEPTRAR